MTKRICINILGIMLICVASVFVFSACGGKNYTYADFQLAYKNYVSTNTYSDTNVNSIFDNTRNVKINYSNEKLVSAISGNSVDDYKLMFTRLSSNTNSNQAIFEPALKASFMMLNRYIEVTPVKAVPTDKANLLMSKLNALEYKTASFKFKLIKFKTLGAEFEQSNSIDQAFLQELMDDFYDLIVASCDLGKTFADVSNTYFWNDVADSDTKRVAPGKIERYYLTQMTSLVDTYARFDLATFYSQAVVINDVEVFTSKKPASKINQMLLKYETGKDTLINFENQYNAGTMNSAEWKIVNSYKEAINYDSTYNCAYKIASKSLSRMGDVTEDLDEEFDANDATQMHREVVSNFVQNEFHNKLNTMLNLMENVLTLSS